MSAASPNTLVHRLPRHGAERGDGPEQVRPQLAKTYMRECPQHAPRDRALVAQRLPSVASRHRFVLHAPCLVRRQHDYMTFKRSFARDRWR